MRNARSRLSGAVPVRVLPLIRFRDWLCVRGTSLVAHLLPEKTYRPSKEEF